MQDEVVARIVFARKDNIITSFCYALDRSRRSEDLVEE
jgi:hypothetical protein